MRIELNGIGVEYDIRGNGAPVLLLHGWGGTIQSFLPVINYLEKTNKVIAFDFPGHGKSGDPNEPWSVGEFCDFTVNFLDKIGIENCAVIGHSFGGRVAIMLSALYPLRVNKLVLCDSAGIIPKRTLKYHIKVKMFKALKVFAKIKFINALFKVESQISKSGSDDYRALSETMKPTFVKVVNQNLRPFLKSIECPTLLIWGDCDKDTPLYMGEIMSNEIRDSALIVFEGAGHYAYLDNFNRFAVIISSFFGGS